MPDTGIVFADAPLTDRLPDPLFLGLDPATLAVEHQQLRDAGRDLTDLADEFETLTTTPDAPDYHDRAATLLDAGHTRPIREDYTYEEPTDLPAIRDRTPTNPVPDTDLDREAAAGAIHGGWVGACAGCLLGKPVQGWSRARITEFLAASGQAPLSSYMQADVDPKVAETYSIHENLEPVDAFIDEVDGMPIDDDIDYIVVGLETLRRHGTDPTPIDIATTWLDTLPVLNTYTAERVAYRNLTNGLVPPESGTHRNPYREMVGALIRADPWGFLAVGDPERAADLAHRDATISHTKNGVYGEMWAAAMIAAAPVVESIDTLIDAGLAQIPTTSRLAEEVAVVRDWYATTPDYEALADKIHDRWDETSIYDWVHTLPNAQVIVAALLASDDDFETAICRAVETGFDTDSHAATLGSILGAYHGIDALPRDWVDPLEDSLSTSVPGVGSASIADLAADTTAYWTDRQPG
ncbi:MAG: ADP-ribosylglycohydrolase family protein [Halobacteriaceae archaeon]